MWSSAGILLLVHYKESLKHIGKMTCNSTMMILFLILDQWKGYTCCRIPSTGADITSFSTISTFPLLNKSSPPRKNIAWCPYSSSGSTVGWMMSHSIVSSLHWHNLAAFYCQNFGELEVSSLTFMLYTRLQTTALAVQYSNLHSARWITALQYTLTTETHYPSE